MAYDPLGQRTLQKLARRQPPAAANSPSDDEQPPVPNNGSALNPAGAGSRDSDRDNRQEVDPMGKFVSENVHGKSYRGGI